MKKKNKIYLAGGMERRADNGETWRRIITPKLEALNYTVFNPCLEENDIFEKHELTPTSLKELKKGRNLELYQSIGKDIVNHDLNAIDMSDIIVVYYDESVNQSSGTTGEMTHARRTGKPIYVIKDVSYQSISLWTLGCIDKFFYNIDEFVNYLKEQK